MTQSRGRRSSTRTRATRAQWGYLADPSIEGRNIQGRDIWDARVTAQVTPKNRVFFSHEHQLRCEGSTLTTQSNEGCRQRGSDWIGVSNVSRPPKRTPTTSSSRTDVTQATWTSPVSSKILLEAGYTRFAYAHNGGPGKIPPDGFFNLIGVTEALAIDGHRAAFTYRGLPTYQDNYGNPNNWRASASYVTGSHNVKFGYQGNYLIAQTRIIRNDNLTQYRFHQPASRRRSPSVCRTGAPTTSPSRRRSTRRTPGRTTG